MLTCYLIRASSSIPLHKPSIKIFKHSTNVFLPFSVLKSFLSPRLSFTFWHRIHLSSFNSHLAAFFSWTPGDPKLLFLFVYYFVLVRLDQILMINIKFKENWYPERYRIQKPVFPGQYCIHQY